MKLTLYPVYRLIEYMIQFFSDLSIVSSCSLYEINKQGYKMKTFVAIKRSEYFYILVACHIEVPHPF